MVRHPYRDPFNAKSLTPSERLPCWFGHWPTVIIIRTPFPPNVLTLTVEEFCWHAEFRCRFCHKTLKHAEADLEPEKTKWRAWSGFACMIHVAIAMKALELLLLHNTKVYNDGTEFVLT